MRLEFTWIPTKFLPFHLDPPGSAWIRVECPGQGKVLYRKYPVNDDDEELPILESHWEEYTWVSRRSADGVIVYDPPIGPTFYTPSSHNNAPDWEDRKS